MKHEVDQLFPSKDTVDSVSQFVEIKVFEHCAAKIDKLSGDLRVSFEIMRNTVQKKIENMKKNSKLSSLISLSDAVDITEEMFESKVCKLVQKVPRSHQIVLMCIQSHYLDPVLNRKPLTQAKLVSTFNTYYAPKLSVPKIQVNALYEIVSYLQESGIIKLATAGKKSETGAKSLMLTKKRVSGINVPGKTFTVELNVDIEELNLAMKKSQIYDALKDPEEEKD